MLYLKVIIYIYIWCNIFTKGRNCSSGWPSCTGSHFWSVDRCKILGNIVDLSFYRQFLAIFP